MEKRCEIQELRVQGPRMQELRVQKLSMQEPKVQEPKMQESRVQEPRVQEPRLQASAPGRCRGLRHLLTSLLLARPHLTPGRVDFRGKFRDAKSI